jgi:hypothetical protein
MRARSREGDDDPMAVLPRRKMQLLVCFQIDTRRCQ